MTSSPAHGRPAIRGLVVVTLDSCRYDSAARAAPEYLSSIATLQAARAHATFTLPAHIALFSGFFPLREHDNASPEALRFVPRLKREGKPADSIRGTVEGRTWLDGLRAAGWYTVGAAGMRWFKNDQLQSGFDEFVYRGPAYAPQDNDIPLWHESDYVLSYPADLVGRLPAKSPWLLFVNAAETHSPYGADPYLLRQQRENSSYRNGKRRLPNTDDTTAFMQALHKAQVDAVRIVDARLEALFRLLPRPFAFIVTADHGEAFGESGHWGHVFNAEPVVRVPMWEGVVDGSA